ncbi:MAPEG family protein [Pleionea mediterranea]|jgi:hypothetical protein|uniref:MAPEG family protein n=1 Tax=Pleionea mediterranea TaxID=523701 RepID=A0A316FWZ2_9GAMM|nr:MAPEG family protein [Pleionea mediterranea]PWK53079.1 hypothetical protein C8D97_104297 [Pleionea mediterranea]
MFETITNHWMLMPVLFNFLLVFIVQNVMYQHRKTAIIQNNVRIRDIAHRHQLEQQLPSSTASSNNFKNQFELPVIFYALVGFFMITGWATWFDFLIACGFVGSRVIHAYIHCTSNRVKIRFLSYIIGTFLLYALFISLAIQWLMHTF